MNIREATLHDANAIADLLDQLGYRSGSGFAAGQLDQFTRDGYGVLVCELDGKVVGFSSMHWFSMFHSPGSMGRITAMCVNEEIRDQGIGGLLLIESEKFLHRQGCVAVEVTSNVTRLMTHRFYLKHGYSEDSRRFIKKFEDSKSGSNRFL
jgi:N-acetylglutamate synthase-like GNAT family acetyltransferase